MLNMLNMSHQNVLMFCAEVEANRCKFDKEAGVKDLGKFISNQVQMMTMALATESVFKNLESIYTKLLNGQLAVSGTKALVDESKKDIHQNWAVQLICKKNLLPAWGWKDQVAVLETINEKPQKFKSWSDIVKFTWLRLARCAVWSLFFEMHMLKDQGSTNELLSSINDESIAVIPDLKIFNVKHYHHIDFGSLTANVDEYGGNDFLDKHLVGFVLDRNKTNFRSLAKAIDSSALTSSQNLLWLRWSATLSKFVTKRAPVRSATVVSGGSTPTSLVEMDEYGFSIYKRSFPGIVMKGVNAAAKLAKAAKATEGDDDDTETVEEEGAASQGDDSDSEDDGQEVYKLEYQLDRMTSGHPVKIKLFKGDMANAFDTVLEDEQMASYPHKNKLTVTFADPSWGLRGRKPGSEFGGIDGHEEMWGRYVF